jgi:hypothetical protein
LGKFQVMRIRRGLLADKATLAADKGEMILASLPRRLLWENKAFLLRLRHRGGFPLDLAAVRDVWVFSYGLGGRCRLALN